ncbi:3'-5' exonuclease [Nocardia gipuzkoensis]
MGLPQPVGHQYDVVYMRPSGHHVVLGTAGTGKTVMAIHRAIHLADSHTENYGPTALLTFNGALTTYLQHLAAEHRNDITIEKFGTFARGYLASRKLMKYNAIARPAKRQALIKNAVEQVEASSKPIALFDRPIQFFEDELAWIEGNGLKNRDAYLEVDRIGRMAALQPAQRSAMWKIREVYRRGLTDCGLLYDWPSVSPALRSALVDDSTERRYRHIVVDEAQDLSPEAIRALALAIPPGGSLTLFADYAQQIYGQRVSWRSCGLSVTKIETFLDNYRNSPQIARLALEMAAMPHFRDSADLVEPRQPQRAAGPKPTLLRCRSTDEEKKIIRQVAQESGGLSRVAILARTREEGRQAAAGIEGVRALHDDTLTKWDIPAGIYHGTYHSAKGLEFDVVILPFCSASRMPDPEVVSAFGPDEAAARESRLLYVGVTRARQELLITYTDALTPLFPPVASDVYQVVS